MRSALTRRGLVTAATAAIVAATMPALAGAESPDAALLALREPYERTLAAMHAVSRAHSAAEDAYLALKTTRPELDERARRKASGLVPAERVWRQAVSANQKVILEIAETPAQTVAGVIFKAEVSDRDGNVEPDLLTSIVDDLVAMGGAHA